MLPLGMGSLDFGFLQRKGYENEKKAGTERTGEGRKKLGREDEMMNKEDREEKFSGFFFFSTYPVTCPMMEAFVSTISHTLPARCLI